MKLTTASRTLNAMLVSSSALFALADKEDESAAAQEQHVLQQEAAVHTAGATVWSPKKVQELPLGHGEIAKDLVDAANHDTSKRLSNKRNFVAATQGGDEDAHIPCDPSKTDGDSGILADASCPPSYYCQESLDSSDNALGHCVPLSTASKRRRGLRRGGRGGSGIEGTHIRSSNPDMRTALMSGEEVNLRLNDFESAYYTIQAEPGDLVECSITGNGDGDLELFFGDTRVCGYAPGTSNETCAVVVPPGSGVSQVDVDVYAFDGTPLELTLQCDVDEHPDIPTLRLGKTVHLDPLAIQDSLFYYIHVTPGVNFTCSLDQDPLDLDASADLYVFSGTQFCESLGYFSNETCTIVDPEEDTAIVKVYGYYSDDGAAIPDLKLECTQEGVEGKKGGKKGRGDDDDGSAKGGKKGRGGDDDDGSAKGGKKGRGGDDDDDDGSGKGGGSGSGKKSSPSGKGGGKGASLGRYSTVRNADIAGTGF